ncbi:MAG: hypothetical protein NT029_13135 [Armatimonadetes bacterium]|nr:hypothetical protein [Armatimonadota bacterium]
MSASVQTNHSSQSRSAADPVSGVQAAAVEAGRALERAREARKARTDLDAIVEALLAERELAAADDDRTSAHALEDAIRRARQARATLLGSAGKPDAGLGSEPSAIEPSATPSREERKAVSGRALAKIAALGEAWDALAAAGFSSPETGINRPALLRARGLLCGVAAVVARAVDEGADGAARDAAEPIMAEVAERMADAGEPWQAPDAATLAALGGSAASAGRLGRLAHAYETGAQAQEAWSRYLLIRGDLNGGRKTLLDHVAAAQALLNRALRGCSVSDVLQNTLYSDLEAEARREQFYLSHLSSSSNEAEARELAEALPQALADAEAAAVDGRAADVRKQRRARAVDAVLRLLSAKPDLGSHEHRIAADRAELLPLLQELLDSGEPASSRLVRDALVGHDPALLEGEPALGAVLAEVQKERERRGIGVEPRPEEEEDPELTDEDMLRMTAEVTPRVEGRSLLLLGGTPRKRLCDQIKRALSCADVVWPPSKKSDSPSRHEPDVRRADVVVLIKNFARHGTGDMARDVTRETGADFLMLPSGYGLNQVIYQLHRYFSGCRREAEA